MAALRVGVDGLAHAAYVDSMLATQLRDARIFMIPTLASLTAGDTSEVARALVRAVGIAHRAGAGCELAILTQLLCAALDR